MNVKTTHTEITIHVFYMIFEKKNYMIKLLLLLSQK